MLIEVNGTNAVLHLLEVRRDIDDVIYRAHVTEHTKKATFAEFDKFLGDPDVIEGWVGEVVANKDVTGNARNVFLDQGVAIDEVVDAVGREDVFQLQAKESGSIGVFDIIIIRVAVEEVGDADAEWAGVSKLAEVDALNSKVIGEAQVVADFEHGIDFGELGSELRHDLGRIHYLQPESLLAFGVFVGDGAGEAEEFVVDKRDFRKPAVVREIVSEGIRDRVEGLSSRDHDRKMEEKLGNENAETRLRGLRWAPPNGAG